MALLHSELLKTSVSSHYNIKIYNKNINEINCVMYNTKIQAHKKPINNRSWIVQSLMGSLWNKSTELITCQPYATH